MTTSFGCSTDCWRSSPLRDFRDRALQGLRTSDNDVYVVESIRGSGRDGALTIHSAATGKEHEIEKAILKPFVSGEQIRAFKIDHTNRWILFPYDLTAGAQLFGRRSMERRFPLAWQYLRACEARLRARERNRMDVDEWWAYIYPKNLEQFEQPKIMLPGFNDEPAAGLDERGVYYNASGYSITLTIGGALSLPVLTTLLNSSLLFWILKRLGVALQRGFVEFRPQYLDRLPIPPLSRNGSESLAALNREGSRAGVRTVLASINEQTSIAYGLSTEERSLVESDN